MTLYKVHVRYQERGPREFRWTYCLYAENSHEARRTALATFQRTARLSSAGEARHITAVETIASDDDVAIVIRGHNTGRRWVLTITGLPSGELVVVGEALDDALGRAIELCRERPRAVVVLDGGISFFVDGSGVRYPMPTAGIPLVLELV